MQLNHKSINQVNTSTFMRHYFHLTKRHGFHLKTTKLELLSWMDIDGFEMPQVEFRTAEL